MTRHHAIEITLTRPATAAELHRARRAVPLATNAERTRLMAVQRAKNPSRALRTLRHQLDALLPIDVLTTYYPDQHGQIRLNLALSHAARTAVRRAAATRGQRPQDFLSQSVTTALARHERQRVQRLTTHLEGLHTHYSAEEVLISAASALHCRRVPPNR
ncbi:hypothetical protein [Streptomyces lunaelactis]|uniref:hypothetical protein n=1 Tax=Streptomyces lunaelactis TaxID=1535768 RepID=UPI001584C0AB|nr:hypothetical protein [Streptomyces lunaelactis]NUJ99647.1 hypothetical protein [Streptomyces lunaelactis]NUK14252.1 hypothetical protein [Streptomyces lunaelactis]